MARQLLLNTLVGVLGEFIDGLTEDNLKLGVSTCYQLHSQGSGTS